MRTAPPRPRRCASVYKEKALGEADINVVYLNGWVALFQVSRVVPGLPVRRVLVTDRALCALL